MQRIARLTLLAASSALLAACADPAGPTAATTARAAVAGEGASRYADTYVWDLTGQQTQFACEDGSVSEPIELQGQIEERSTYMQTPSGRIQTLDVSRPVGLRGVGLETGQAYQVVERVHHRTQYANGGQNGSRRETWTIRNVETRATFTLTWAIHWRFDENAELISSRQREHFACQL